MSDRGIRWIDIAETRQVLWLLVPVEDCPDQSSEERLTRSHFLVPHTTWSWPKAFVEPVSIVRTCRRVLFRQQLGIEL